MGASRWNRSLQSGSDCIQSHWLKHISSTWSNFLIKPIWILSLTLYRSVSFSFKTCLGDGFFFNIHTKRIWLFIYGMAPWWPQITSISSPESFAIIIDCRSTQKTPWLSFVLGIATVYTITFKILYYQPCRNCHCISICCCSQWMC